MTRLIRTTVVSLTMLFVSLATPALTRAAEPAMAGASMAPVDCSTAATQMTQMMQMPSAAMPAAASGKATSGDAMSVDKMFSSNMSGMMQRGHMMASIEMQCGKDPATRAQAKQLFDDTAKYTQDAMKQEHPL